MYHDNYDNMLYKITTQMIIVIIMIIVITIIFAMTKWVSNVVFEKSF